MQAHLRNSKSSLINQKECHVIKNIYHNDIENSADNNDEDKQKFQIIECNDSPSCSKQSKTAINYETLKKQREAAEKSVIVNQRADSEEIWPIIRNNINNSRRILKSSTTSALTEEKVTVV